MATEHIEKSNSESASTINLTETLYQPTWRPSDSRPAKNQPNRGRIRKQTYRISTVSGPNFLTSPISADSRDKEKAEDGTGHLVPLLQVSGGVVEPKPKHDVHEDHLPPVTGGVVGSSVGSPKQRIIKPEKVLDSELSTSDNKEKLDLPNLEDIASGKWRPEGDDKEWNSESILFDIDHRREKRHSRPRPWTENPPVVRSEVKDKVKVEVHYATSLPPKTWVKSEPKKYAKNIKWGETYVIRRVNGKIVMPADAEWSQDDGFRVWLLQRSAATKMGIDVQKIMFADQLKHLKGRTKAALESYAAQKELYQRYLSEKKEREMIERAAILFQKHARGWLERVRLKKLKEKVILESRVTYKGFIQEYKGLLSRVMQRNGLKPKATFTVEMAYDYLERRKHASGIFRMYSVSNHLPLPLLDKFMEDSGIQVTEDKLEYAFNLVFGGCSSRADVVLLIDLPVSLGEEKFQSQLTFLQELVDCLHIHPFNVRMGYVPFKTDVFVGFSLGQCGTREEVKKGLDKVRYHKGIHRTDIALRTMRRMFQKNPRLDGKEVPKVAIMLTEGGGFASHVTRKQAQGARNKDNIHIYGIVLGKNENINEILAVTGYEDHVIRIPNYYALWGVRAELMEMANLQNCRYCDWKSVRHTGLDTGRGLTLQEALEVMWQLAPPGSIPKNPTRKAKPLTQAMRFNDDDELLPEKDGNDALFDPCLRFIIKSKLDHQGMISLPRGGDTDCDVTVTTWREAMKRAEEYEKLEERKKEKEEEEKRKGGYRENIIKASDSEEADSKEKKTAEVRGNGQETAGEITDTKNDGE